MKKNEYGLFTAIAMIVGIVIGSGIFFKSDNILIATGGSISLGILVFSLAAIAIIFGSLTISELASRTTKSGGIIAYAEEYASKSTACAFGWFQVFLYYPALLAVVSWVAGVYMCMLFGIEGSLVTQIAIGVAIVIVLFITNTISAQIGGALQNASTILKLIPLVLIAVVGLIYGDTSHISFSDVVSFESMGWATALAPIAFSYDGWIIATSIGHEIKDSKKNLPRALIVAPIFILIMYIVYFVGVCTYLGPERVMALGDEHLNIIANDILGPIGAKVLLVFIIISIVGALNGIILGLIRMPHSLATRNMFPMADKISKVNEKTNMPLNSAIVGFVLFGFWTILHYVSTKLNLLPNSDVSEISTTISYLLYAVLYVKVLELGRKGVVKGIWRGFVNPVLAIIGSLIIVAGSLSNPLFIVYIAVCGMVILAARFFWRKKEKELNIV